jgi:yersiniabactin salicyl-AMP ligase
MEQTTHSWGKGRVGEYLRRGYWEHLTLGEHLRSWARTHAGRTALVDRKNRWTYEQFDRRVDRLASALYALGFRPGNRVLLQLPNGIPFATTCFALFRLGAVPILAMTALRENDIDSLCAVGEPVAYFVADNFLGFEHLAVAEAMASKHASLRHIIVVGEAGLHTPFETLDAKPMVLPVPDPQSVALLLLSGGTTNTPKLIPRTHADYAYNAKESAQVCGLDPSTVYLAALPVAHNFPLACPGILGTLSKGGAVVFAQTPGFDEAFPLIEMEGVTVTALVPALVPLWIQAREWDATDLSSLKLLQVGGARLEPDLAMKIKPALGCALQQVFGMAEGLLCYTRLDDSQEVVLNTQGRPMSPGDEVRIVDERGDDVAEGEEGELWVRGPYTIGGYYRAEEHNRVAFTPDGYYRSGDKVRRTTEGNLVVVARIKDQINRAGEKISAAEVEEHLLAHPLVREVAVTALADASMGEICCAFLITEGGEVLDLPALYEFLRSRGVPRHKWPDRLERVLKWPLTPIGKIDKKALSASVRQGVVSEPWHRYCEREIEISSEPLVLAGRLIQTGISEDVTLYERIDEWSLGFGVAVKLSMTPDAVTLESDTGIQSWPITSFPDVISSALKHIPISGWRAYGAAQFELARIFHGLPRADESSELLHLIIPRMEVRFRDGIALVRALSTNEFEALSELITEMDRNEDGVALSAVRRVTTPVRTEGAEIYKQRVATAVKEIQEGSYRKVILSRRVTIPEAIDPVASYVAGRQGNTPARSFYLSRPGFTAAGYSPETVVEVTSDGWVSTQPLAGTRSLGNDFGEEEVLRDELLRDEKEIAEHAMSVRQAMDEIETTCENGSIHVSEFMSIRRRGSVQHLASRVKGRLKSGISAWNAFKALFPAVTASGIPKRDAIDAIGRHETQERGLYSGSVMIVDCDGGLDAALVLRSFYQQSGKQWMQAGAGLIALSTPQRELEETCEKLLGVSEGLIAQTGALDSGQRKEIIYGS